MKRILFLATAFIISFNATATVIVSSVGQLKTAIQNANNGMDADILIADGIYDLDGAYLLIARAGISVKSQSGNRSAVILDGNYVSSEIFQIIASNVTIADLTLQKAKDHPIHIMGGDNSDITGVVVSNVHIIDPGQQAIKINPRNGYSVNNGIIKDCKIELTESGRNYVWNHNGSCYTGGIDAHSASGWEIRDNEIKGFWCSAGLSEHGIHFWNDSKNTLVERNLIIDCDRGIGFGLSSSAHHGGIIRNNMIFHPGNHGFSDVGIGLESADNVKVYNNTIFLNHNYPNAIEYRFAATNGGIIKNNLTNKAITSRNGGTADVMNNVTDAVASWFVNAANGDLHLTSEINGLAESGVEIMGLTDDFDKDLRPIGERIDIGADEYRIPESTEKSYPVIHFSDLTDGAVSGWEQSGTKGMAVSIWGRGFGQTRNESYVTVGGVDLKKDSDYAEWAATSRPKVPLGMQRITFFLNSKMITGGAFPNTTITVTTQEGTSNSIPFHTRVLGDNHIYFIDNVNGDDNNSGLYSAINGTDGPCKTTGWARQHLKAGDAVYIRDKGVAYSDENSHDDDSDNYQFCSGGLFTFCDYEIGDGGGAPNHSQGIEGKSISVIGFPGESPKVESLNEDGAYSFIRTVWEKLEYWTFSKFTVNGLQPFSQQEEVYPPYDSHLRNLRLVGHDWTTPGVDNYDYGDGMDFVGGNGSSYLYILGVYFHDIGTDTHHGEPGTTDFRCYAIYFNGYGTTDHIEVGWNELDYTSYGRGFQFYGHHEGDWIDNVHFHNNWVHNTSRQSLIFSGEGGDVDYSFVKNVYIYNNILERSGEGDVVLQMGGQYGNGRFGGNYYVYNNVLDGNNNDEYPTLLIGKDINHLDFKNNIIHGVPNGYDYISYFPDSSPPDDISASNNLYFGAGDGAKPAWDNSTLSNNNPFFVKSPGELWSDFKVLENSPVINAGDNTIDISSVDFEGRNRGENYDIGAFNFSKAIMDNPIKVEIEQRNITCFNVCDGKITIDTIENAVMPIKYMWSTGDTTNQVNDLCAGNYTITITDKNGKTIVKTIVLTQPEELLLNIDHTDETSNNANDGSISFSPSGGTSPYRIYWDSQIVTGTISNLSPGQFFFTLIDANGCSVEDSVVIEKFICPELFINSEMIDASCFGYCDGSISIIGIDNSTMPIHYNWDNGDTTSILSYLCAKDYNIEITDGKNCTVSQSFSITQPDDILITIDSTKDVFTNQPGYIAISSNNTGNYTFSWIGPDGFSTDSEDIFNLNAAGCYTLSIQDTTTKCSKEFEICIADKTATNNLDIGKIYLYPNPARGYIYIDFFESKFTDLGATISFFDIAGKKQMQVLKNPDENLLKIETKDLSSQMFIIRIKTDRFGVIYKKMIVDQ